jgi:hypothetical protein
MTKFPFALNLSKGMSEQAGAHSAGPGKASTSSARTVVENLSRVLEASIFGKRTGQSAKKGYEGGPLQRQQRFIVGTDLTLMALAGSVTSIQGQRSKDGLPATPSIRWLAHAQYERGLDPHKLMSY